MNQPESTKGWIRFTLSVLERGGPVTALVLGLCAMAMIYGLYKELARVHEVSHMFFNRLEVCYQAQLAMARRCPLDGDR